MNAIDAIRTGYAKSLQFSGRASRAEFWRRFGGTLATVLMSQVLALLILINTLGGDAIATGPVTIKNLPFLLLVIISAAFFSFLMLSTTARRFQDHGWSGHWFRWMLYPLTLCVLSVLTAIIGYMLQADNLALSAALVGFFAVFCPYASVIWTFWIGFVKPDPTPNRYGPNPLEASP